MFYFPFYLTALINFTFKYLIYLLLYSIKSGIIKKADSQVISPASRIKQFWFQKYVSAISVLCFYVSLYSRHIDTKIYTDPNSSSSNIYVIMRYFYCQFQQGVYTEPESFWEQFVSKVCAFFLEEVQDLHRNTVQIGGSVSTESLPV